MGVPWHGLAAACVMRLGTLGAEMGTITALAGAVGFVLLSRRRPCIALLLGLAFASGLLQSSLYGTSPRDYLIPCEMVIATTAAYCLTCPHFAWPGGPAGADGSLVPQTALLALALLVMGNGLRETGRVPSSRAVRAASRGAMHCIRWEFCRPGR